MEELLTDVVLQKAKQTIVLNSVQIVRNRLNGKKYPCYTLLASQVL